MKTKEIKKRSSTLKTIISIALAALLCVSIALPVFAEDDPVIGPGVVTGSEAAITKQLDTPVGTVLPTGADALKFTFEIKKLKFNDKVLDATTIDMVPHLGTPKQGDTTNTLSEIDITFDGGYAKEAEANGTKSIFKETKDLFKDVTWPSAGVYTYEIREIPGTNIRNPLPIGYTEIMTYSPALYTMSVWVVEENGKLVVKYIGDVQTKTNEGTEGGVKVDPTPGNTTTEGVGPYSKMIFINTYIKNNGGTDPKDPNNTTLKVSKTVAGDSASKIKYFAFDITVTKPTLASGTPVPTYKAYVMEADGSSSKVVTTTDNYATIDPVDKSITFTSGTKLTINLKHGQWLAFTDLPVGSEFIVKENKEADYSPSCTLTAYSGQAKKFESVTIDKAPAFGVDLTVPGDIANFGQAYVGDRDTSKPINTEENKLTAADFTNTFKPITPTGIGVDDLPYIVIITLVVAVVAGYIVFRVRRRPKEEV